jgi:hypothetical protein
MVTSPGQSRSGAGGWRKLIVCGAIFAVLAGVWVTWHILDDAHNKPFTPHGQAAKVCEVKPDHENPKIIRYGHTWYDSACLARYGQ